MTRFVGMLELSKQVMLVNKWLIMLNLTYSPINLPINLINWPGSRLIGLLLMVTLELELFSCWSFHCFHFFKQYLYLQIFG